MSTEKILKSQGDFLYKLNRFDEAIKKFDKAIIINPHNALFYYNKGLCLKRMGIYEEAITEFDKAIQLNNQSSLNHKKKGISLKNIKKYAEAINEFGIAIKINPFDPSNFNNKGNVFYELEKFPEALAEYDKAIELNPNKFIYYINKGNVLYDMQKYENALDEYVKAIKVHSGNSSNFGIEKIKNKITQITTENLILKDKIELYKTLKKKLQDEFENFVERDKIENQIFPLRSEEKFFFKIEEISIDYESLDLSENLILYEEKQKDIFDFCICKICFNLVRNAKSCNQCEDLFCSFCLKFCLGKKNKCPHCREFPFCERKINKNVKTLLGEISLKCPLFCGEIFKYKNMDKHFEKCTHKPKHYICELCDLIIKVESNDLSQVTKHNKECPNTLFKCPDCNKDFKFKDIDSHMMQCRYNHFFCKKCNFEIPKKFSLAHKHFFCEKFTKFNNLENNEDNCIFINDSEN